PIAAPTSQHRLAIACSSPAKPVRSKPAPPATAPTSPVSPPPKLRRKPWREGEIDPVEYFDRNKIHEPKVERALHDVVLHPHPEPLDFVLANDAKPAALEERPRRQAGLGEQASHAECPRARLDLAQQARGDARPLVHVVGVEAIDSAAALE